MDVHFCSLSCVSSAACPACWWVKSPKLWFGGSLGWSTRWLLRPLLEPLCLLEPAPTCSGVLAEQRAISLVLFSGWEPADSARWNGFVQVRMNVEAGRSERVGTCSRREVRDYASQELVWLKLLWNCSLRAVRDLLMWGFLVGWLGGWLVGWGFFFWIGLGGCWSSRQVLELILKQGMKTWRHKQMRWAEPSLSVE